MFKVVIPGFANIALKHLVMDYNGTLAQDGEPVPGVYERFKQVAHHLQLHVITNEKYS